MCSCVQQQQAKRFTGTVYRNIKSQMLARGDDPTCCGTVQRDSFLETEDFFDFIKL